MNGIVAGPTTEVKILTCEAPKLWATSSSRRSTVRTPWTVGMITEKNAPRKTTAIFDSDAEPEPQDEERDQGDAGQGVEEVQPRVGHVRQALVPAERQSERDGKRDGQDVAADQLEQADPDVVPEPGDLDLPGPRQEDVGGLAEEELIDDPEPAAELPAADEDPDPEQPVDERFVPPDEALDGRARAAIAGVANRAHGGICSRHQRSPTRGPDGMDTARREIVGRRPRLDQVSVKIVDNVNAFGYIPARPPVAFRGRSRHQIVPPDPAAMEEALAHGEGDGE